jgi:Recombination endonuclease VII
MADASADAERKRERRRQYRAANRDKINAQKRAWAAANRDKISEQDRQYYQANRDKLLEQKREYYKATRQQQSEKNRQRYQANRDEVLARVKTYADANRPKIQEYHRRYYATRGGKVREKVLERAHGPNIAAEWAEMWDAQQGLCYLCGLAMDPDDTHIEHWHGCSGHAPKMSCRYCRRGLAHPHCNLIVGHAGDDPALLRVVADNLEKANAAVLERQADKPHQDVLDI